jgi:ankyrin repeat protein
MSYFLLQCNASIESFNESTQQSALYCSVANGHAEVPRFLLERGADVDSKLVDGHTPLFRVVIQGNVELVELLLQYGAIGEYE